MRQEKYYRFVKVLVKRFWQLKLLRQIKITEQNKLGNFLMSVYHHPLTGRPLDFYLTKTIVNDTRNEMNRFLNAVLVNITGEEHLEWNLHNAMDLMLVTGIGKEKKLYKYPCKYRICLNC
jgi:hypothetical protein